MLAEFSISFHVCSQHYKISVSAEVLSVVKSLDVITDTLNGFFMYFINLYYVECLHYDLDLSETIV